MKQSFSFYLTLFVIRLQGIKKSFSSNPIDYVSIRKGDIHQPKGAFYKSHLIQTIQISDSTITEIGLDRQAKKLLIFIHGGAFVSGPASHHWDTIKTIAKNTNHKIWLCDYPKAPENKIDTICSEIDAIYKTALESFDAQAITLIGDSVGGNLATTLIQRLVANQLEVPNQLILITPVMDASMSNPDIASIEQNDPILAKAGVLSAKTMCAGKHDLKDPLISPIYGSFEGFPAIYLFIAQNDIMYPDGKMAAEKMIENGVNLTLIEGINMPHIWPILPVMKEAKTALGQIIAYINN